MNRGVVSAPNGMNLMVTKMFGGARNDHEVQNISDINLEMEECQAEGFFLIFY